MGLKTSAKHAGKKMGLKTSAKHARETWGVGGGLGGGEDGFDACHE